MGTVIKHAADANIVFQQHSAASHGARNTVHRTPNSISPKLCPISQELMECDGIFELQRSVASYLSCVSVVNNRIKKGLLLSLRVNFF